MNVQIIDILSASDNELMELSRKNVLSLSLIEMKAVKTYFKKLGRNPTDVELETVAQTWSEHCKHKTLTGIVEYEYKTKKGSKKKRYNNLLKETVFRATQELDKEWCVSVFKDNAGVIEFDDTFGAAFKVETHNHPSALEPYGGSATGIGGVIRDILGVGLGAKPLANTDVFCFGNPNLPWSKLPQGMLHPKRIAKGVVSGVRDYGNRMGIPTVNGAVCFDEGYTSNPLVYCGTLGLIPKDKSFKKVEPGDLVLVVGGRTGRDGIHGATFSSTKLDQDTDVAAVQIGNAIVEKKVLDTMLQARDLNLYRAVTDCGAGGLSSAVGELGEDCGVIVHLENIPLKYAGLKPWEIWLSEAQERMVFAVPRENKDKLAKLFASENVEAVYIGEFKDDGKLTVMYGLDTVAEMDMEFLHKGVPRPTHTAVWVEKSEKPMSYPATISRTKSFGKDLRGLLGSLNICSREWIIRQYDHEVQGQTVVKPLHGSSIAVSGPGDASVIWPYTMVKDSYKGIVVSNGLNPDFGKIDPYWMAASAIDEALRNAVCVGADIERMSLLDNFCWGNPYRPEVLGSLVRAAEACYEFSKKYGAPFISGKDSLHNEYAVGGKSYSIPPTLLISAMGIVPDVRSTITMDLKAEGNLLYIVGETKNEMAGSQYARIHALTGGSIPKVDAAASLKRMKAVGKGIRDGVIVSCHDCSEGGLGVAIAEMCIAGDRGAEVTLTVVPQDGKLPSVATLFAESNSRFVIEVRPENKAKFEALFRSTPFGLLGTVTGGKTLKVTDKAGTAVINEKIEDLRTSWRSTLAW